VIREMTLEEYRENLQIATNELARKNAELTRLRESNAELMAACQSWIGQCEWCRGTGILGVHPCHNCTPTREVIQHAQEATP
jgi:hypothetical protein